MTTDIVATSVLDNAKSLPLIAPELAIAGAALAVILWDLFVRGRGKLEGMAFISLAALAYSGVYGLSRCSAEVWPTQLFGGLLVVDRTVHVFRSFFALVTGIVVLLALPRKGQRLVPFGRGDGQLFTLLLCVSLGLNFMAMSQHLLMIYISLELVSVISFVLAGFKVDDRKSWEGALKYAIFGGFSSGIMLYGMSWIYGLTRSLDLPTIMERVTAMTIVEGHVPAAVVVGVICMLAGFGYKISAAPFHMWAPDVYEGAPTQVTMFLSVGPKAAGFVVMLRFFQQGLGAHASFAPGLETWKTIAGAIAIATMTVGNLSALNQENVKRMLAFSSIAHAGYMLLGFAVFSGEGATAIYFYVCIYCVMNLGAFLVQMAVAEETGTETIAGFRGLGARAPFVAVAMTMFLFSLAGIPPLAGFVGKFYIFMALIKAGGTYGWVLALFGILNSVISVFYYARVARAMWLEKAETGEGIGIRSLYGWTMAALAVPTLALGLYWMPVYNWVHGSLLGK